MVLVPPDLPIGSPIVRMISSPSRTAPRRRNSSSASLQQFFPVAIVAALEVDWVNAAIKSYFSTCFHLGCQGIDGHAGAACATSTDRYHRTGSWRQSPDIEMQRSKCRRHRDGFVRPQETVSRRVLVNIGSDSFSASRQTRSMAATASMGYWPAAVSADSMMASVPSSTALATSDTSARVGIGLEIMDSIICVAVIASLLRSRASADHFLLQGRHCGITNFHTQVAARHHDGIRYFQDFFQMVIASARSIFATI